MMINQLKLTDVRKTLPFNIQKGMTAYSISALSENRHDDIEIDYDVFLESKGINLQRDFCWTLQQKQELILSVLKGIQLNSFVIIQFKDHIKAGRPTIYKIIDGKQRLSTLISFYRNEFPIIVNEKTYFYDDMELAAQRLIRYFEPKFDIVYEYWDKRIPDSVLIDWFEMINFAGTPQDVKHLNNLRK